MKTFIAILLAFIMLSSSVTAAVKNMKKSAHKGQDRFSDENLWVDLKSTDIFISKQHQNGGRCLSDNHCDAPNRCSYWGWCQDSSYEGPFIPENL